MGDDWIEYLQETIERNVGAILDGEGFEYIARGEKHTDLFIIFELFHYKKKKEALILVDELGME